MNRPSMMTRELTAPDMKALAKIAMNSVQIAGAFFLVAYALGFRAEKPGERFDALEKRVSTIEARLPKIESNSETSARLNCMGITRRDANWANACQDYPTRDETTRVRP